MYDYFDSSSDCDLCLYTLPSPGGSGKTYTIAREAHRLALQGQRVLIAQPTIDLIEKTLADEIEVLSPQVDCKAIHSQHSDNVLRDVKYRLMKKDDDPGPKGQITLITHAELIKIQGLEDREDIILYIDEVPAAEKCLLHNLFETHQLLTDNIDVVPEGPIYGRVYASDEDSLEQIARNKTKDDLWKEIFDTAWILLSDAWEPYVNMEQYQKLLQGEARQIIFHCVLRPEVLQGYKRVTIAGANLEDSILYHLFTQQGVTFKVDKSLTNKLRYNSHQRGDLITIGYGFCGFWSKRKQTLKSVTDDDSATNLDRVVDASSKRLACEEGLNKINDMSIEDKTEVCAHVIAIAPDVTDKSRFITELMLCGPLKERNLVWATTHRIFKSLSFTYRGCCKKTEWNGCKCSGPNCAQAGK